MKPLMRIHPFLRAARRQRGFTLVEMMVAVGIGLAIALGFAVSFVNLKGTWNTQDKLAQLQDNERLAMSFLTSSIEQAGYFADSVHQTKATALPAFADATYGNSVAGQYVMGTDSSSGIPVSLSTVYSTTSGDGVMSCQGTLNDGSIAATVSVRNIFYVDTTKHTLNCSVTTQPTPSGMNATAAALVSNVDSMSVLYAVDTDADGSADKYVSAASMTSANWPTVKAVRVTVRFINPNPSAGASTVAWTQTINLMNNQ
jgi:type IV pilus assembly protein PilW